MEPIARWVSMGTAGVVRELLDLAWRVAGFLAPPLRRWFRHRRFFAFHMRLALYLFVVSAAVGLWLGFLDWPSLSLPHAKWWRWTAVIPPALLLLAYVRMAREKPKMPGLARIQDALASGGKSDLVPLGQIFWNHIPSLSRRAEVKQIIRLWDDGASIVLMEGYSASGKSAIAEMAGKSVVDRGSLLLPASVYYLNLTTHRGCPAGGGSPTVCIEKALDAVEGSRGDLVYLIVEDIHHDLPGFDRFNRFLNERGVRLLLTSRPIKDYTLSGRGLEAAEGRRLLAPLAWVGKEHSLQLSTDRQVVEAIIKRRGAGCDDLDAVLSFVDRKEPNLLLLSFAIEAAKSQGKPVNRVSENDVEHHLRAHWRETAERLGLPEADLFCVLNSLSVVSEFEVPATRSFIAAASGRDSSIADATIRALVKERVMIELAAARPEDEPYCLLPHARLAGIHRRLWVEPGRRQDLLLTYLRTQPFIGTLVWRLLREDSECLLALVESRRGGIVEVPLRAVALYELGSFLYHLCCASGDLAKEVARQHRQEILNRSLTEAPLWEIGRFLPGLAWVAKDLATELVERHQEEIRGRSLEGVPLGEICGFLEGLSKASRGLATELVERHREEILGRSLAEATLEEIGDLLSVVAALSGSVTKDVVERHREEILGRSLAGASLWEIYYFLRRATIASADLAREVAGRHGEEILALSLAEATLPMIAYFLSGVACASEDLARELVVRHREEILGASLAGATLLEIGHFLSAVAEASEDLAKEVAEERRQEIGRSLAGATLREIRDFLRSVGRASADVAREVAERHREDILGRSIAGAALLEIGNFLWGVATASAEVAREVAERHREEILGRSLEGAAVLKIGYFLRGVAAASTDLAREVVERHRGWIAKAYVGAPAGERRSFKRLMPSWLLDVLGLPEE